MIGNKRIYEDIESVVKSIEGHYFAYAAIWDEELKKHPEFCKINLKRKQVCDVMNDEQILKYILFYRELLNGFMPDMLSKMLSNPITQDLEMRVKNKNSVDYKLQNYLENHENGKVPLIKCVNDLMGLRMVVDDEIDEDELIEYISGKGYKCINSSKGNYRAVHIYIERDNYSFPWELQIWEKQFADGNLESHRAYKQDYTNWERRTKEVKL